MAHDPRRHAEVWAVLPWLANGRATPEQQALADAHLPHCADCRAELDRERRLAAAFAAPVPATPDAEAGLQRLMQRLDFADEPLPAPPPRPPRRLHAWAAALATVGVLELVLLGALAGGWRPGGDAPYQTLSRPAPHADGGPRWRVVFDDRLALHDLHTLLREQGLTVEAGPSEAGVYTLASTAPEADADARAARLRALPQVRFAEALPPR